jgi:transcriptional regulator with PAS, ATPase and Fis domain
LGETGTGKELFARAIHTASERANKPFVAINCSAFSKELLESELFGYKAGAFTGAVRDKVGLLEEADGGTLFLDELGELDFDLQAKLLRVLEESEFIKLGDTKSSNVDFRLISATNKDLYLEMSEGRFREDLFYRINVFTLRLPSLIERKADIALLTKYYIDVYAKKLNKNVKDTSSSFLEKLKKHSWPGNIRELRNVIERAVILSDGPVLTEEYLPGDLKQRDSEMNSTPSHNITDLESVEKNHIKHILNQTKGNKIKAAGLLKIGIATLYRKIEQYKLNTF